MLGEVQESRPNVVIRTALEARVKELEAEVAQIKEQHSGSCTACS